MVTQKRIFLLPDEQLMLQCFLFAKSGVEIPLWDLVFEAVNRCRDSAAAGDELRTAELVYRLDWRIA